MTTPTKSTPTKSTPTKSTPKKSTPTKSTPKKSTVKEITNKSTVKDIKEYLKLNNIDFNTKDTKAQLMALINENKEVKEVQDIFNLLANDKNELKKVKDRITTNENKAVPLVLSIITMKSNNNLVFNALSKKGKLKEVKKLIGSKNKLINDTLTFLLHNNLSYSNTINIANIRGINALIAKKITVKIKVNDILDTKEVKEAKEDKEVIYNDAIKEVLAGIRKEIKAKEAKEAKETARLAKEALEYKDVINDAKETAKLAKDLKVA